MNMIEYQIVRMCGMILVVLTTSELNLISEEHRKLGLLVGRES
jgi:hypothetical protein